MKANDTKAQVATPTAEEKPVAPKVKESENAFEDLASAIANAVTKVDEPKPEVQPLNRSQGAVAEGGNAPILVEKKELNTTLVKAVQTLNKNQNELIKPFLK